ncbi:MAG: hypothetical protein IKP17_00655 [Oscillospiraceae bacterium]|jgi:hypothetical protein|nr:hypothetical protein [Oscillospiraceae bacterium]
MSEEKRYIVCAGCGRQVDPAQTPVYYDFNSGKNYCESCHSGGAAPVKRRRPWASALRIIFGALFVIIGFDFIKDGDGSTAAFSLVVGLVLLLWQFWPQLKRLVARSRRDAAVRRNDAAAAAREAERVKICPHCGGSGTGKTCPYCGMPYGSGK